MAWDFLTSAYPWVKAFHVMSVMAWMAGLFYLPRLFVYHAEKGRPGTELSETLKIMEIKLLKFIMRPAMISTWFFGILLVLVPGMIDWTDDIWIWIKIMFVLLLTWQHHAMLGWCRTFERDANTRPGRYYRLMNEVPTLGMVVIVIMVIVKPF